MRPYPGDVKLDMLNARRFPPEYAALLAGYIDFRGLNSLSPIAL